MYVTLAETNKMHTKNKFKTIFIGTNLQKMYLLICYDLKCVWYWSKQCH